MPLYNVTTQAGVLNDDAKAKFAAELTTFHSDYSRVPKDWVQVIFNDFAPGSSFSGGRPSAVATLMLHIRTGRSEEYKTEMVQRLWTLFQSATQASDNQIVVAISEVPPGQAMEMGKVMPVVAKE